VPLRRVEQPAAKAAPDPQALSCYGRLRDDTGPMRLRFVQGRPGSQGTEDFLGGVCARLAAAGQEALRVIWDNARWPTSQRVRAWIKGHNRHVKQPSCCRRAARSEGPRRASAAEVQERVWADYHCDLEPPLVQIIEKRSPDPALGSHLQYRQASPIQSLIEPAQTMTLDDFQKNVAATQSLWRKLP
jgi:hypothetical protein